MECSGRAERTERAWNVLEEWRAGKGHGMFVPFPILSYHLIRGFILCGISVTHRQLWPNMLNGNFQKQTIYNV